MAAVSASASVKLAMIWPSLAMAGVLIAPARPPMPRLSVLPAAIDVGLGELTTPPSAMVSVPTRLQPQPLSPPIVSELSAFRTEPAPVTVTVEAPVTSPMNIGAVALTVPPLATVSMPGPSVLPPPTRRAGPPTFQVEPGPVTSTDGMPSSGTNVSISEPPWLLNTAPLAIVSEPGPKNPTTVTPLAVTVEPAPVTIMLPATRTSVVCSVPPLVTVSVPTSTSTKLPAVNDPPLIVIPPAAQPHNDRVKSPPMLLLPVSVSVPLPSFTRLPPAPPSWIEPLSVVERSLLPTVSSFDPIEYVPAPSIEPAVILPLLSGPEVPEKSTVPPALAMNRALPPLLLAANCVSAPVLVVMVALPAVLVSVKDSKKPPLVTIIELPAEPLLIVIAPLLVKLGANAELLTMPAPLI